MAALSQLTIAEGSAIPKPIRSRALLQALQESCGLIFAVTEEEIAQAQTRLARADWYVESTSAVAAAALSQVQPHISPGERVVVVLTRSGLKSPHGIHSLISGKIHIFYKAWQVHV
ncbi:MAG: pyridoxal-phosphate dependent enzyme [Anaerolineae bacterium]|nr:pyridoxal-phosphate dependent enzyme [Anaerolineae bacterium]